MVAASATRSPGNGASPPGALLSDGEFHDVGIALGAGHGVDPACHRGLHRILRSPFR